MTLIGVGCSFSQGWSLTDLFEENMLEHEEQNPADTIESLQWANFLYNVKGLRYDTAILSLSEKAGGCTTIFFLYVQHLVSTSR